MGGCLSGPIDKKKKLLTKIYVLEAFENIVTKFELVLVVQHFEENTLQNDEKMCKEFVVIITITDEIIIIYNYFAGKFLLYRGFPRAIWPAKYHERNEGYFTGQIGQVKFLISRKSCCTQFYRLLE